MLSRRLSVRLSVCLSHTGIVLKLLNTLVAKIVETVRSFSFLQLLNNNNSAYLFYYALCVLVEYSLIVYKHYRQFVLVYFVCFMNI